MPWDWWERDPRLDDPDYMPDTGGSAKNFDEASKQLAKFFSKGRGETWGEQVGTELGPVMMDEKMLGLPMDPEVLWDEAAYDTAKRFGELVYQLLSQPDMWDFDLQEALHRIFSDLSFQHKSSLLRLLETATEMLADYTEVKQGVFDFLRSIWAPSSVVIGQEEGAAGFIAWEGVTNEDWRDELL